MSLTLTPVSGDTYIRWVCQNDIPELVKIEWQSKENMWNELDFKEVLLSPNMVGLVGTRMGVIHSFAYFQLHKKFIAITNFVVHSDFRRKGYGSLMLDKLKSELEFWDRTHLVYYVRESNLTGHLFLQSNGFKATEVDPEFFTDITAEKTTVEPGYRFEYYR